MSEAAECSVTTVERPPTLKQKRLAAALLDPNNTTAKAAVLAAGYDEITAVRNPGMVIGGLGTQRELQRLQRLATKRDKARGVRDAALERIEARINDDSASDALIVGAVKVCHDISQDSPADDTADASESLRKYRRAIHLAFLFGYIAAKRAFAPQHVVVAPAIIETTEKNSVVP